MTMTGITCTLRPEMTRRLGMPHDRGTVMPRWDFGMLAASGVMVSGATDIPRASPPRSLPPPPAGAVAKLMSGENDLHLSTLCGPLTPRSPHITPANGTTLAARAPLPANSQ